MKISQWDNIFKAATSKYETESKKQAGKISLLDESVNQLTTTKVVVEEELKKEKTTAEETQQELDEAKTALLASEETRKNLEARVDVTDVTSRNFIFG